MFISISIIKSLMINCIIYYISPFKCYNIIYYYLIEDYLINNYLITDYLIYDELIADYLL